MRSCRTTAEGSCFRTWVQPPSCQTWTVWAAEPSSPQKVSTVSSMAQLSGRARVATTLCTVSGVTSTG